MPRLCTICTSEHRLHIDQQLIERVPFRNIAARFGISTGALVRHRDAHLPASLAKAQDAKEIIEADSLLAHAIALRDRAMGLLDKAEDAEDHRAAVAAIREARSCLELQGKVSGELKQGGVTVNVGFSLPDGLDAIADRQQRVLKDVTPKPKVIEHSDDGKT